MGILGVTINNPGFPAVIAGLYTTSDGSIPPGLETEWGEVYGYGIA